MNILLGDRSKLTRREALITLNTCLSDAEELVKIVGKDPVLDMALYGMAQTDDRYMSNLQKVMDVPELQADVLHTYRDRALRERLSSMTSEESK